MFLLQVPSELAQLTKLTSFMIVQNLITGSVPLWLTTMPSLLELLLGENMFTGTVS
jgi:hypothetical protein